MKIRPYKQSYYKEATDILKEAGLFDDNWHSEENLKSMVTGDFKKAYVAVENNNIIRFILIVLFGSKVANFFSLAVDEQSRGRGVGSSLLSHCENILKNRGFDEIGCYVRSTKDKLIDFYKNKGYGSSMKDWIYIWKDL